MAPARPSAAQPQCSCPPSNSNAPMETPDHLGASIKIPHPQGTTPTSPIRNPNPNPHPTPETHTDTPTTHAQQIPEPPSTLPSTLRSILSHLSSQTTTLDLLSSHLTRIEAVEASSRETQRKQLRLSKKQHARFMAKVEGLEGVLTCIHDEFHGEGGAEEQQQQRRQQQQQQQGSQKKMCERIDRMEKLVVWAWSEMMEMRKGIDAKMGRVEEKIERVVGLLGEMGGGEEEKEGGLGR